MISRPGAALLIAVILAGLLLGLAVIAAKIVYNSCATEDLLDRRERAFWLATAGLEQGKAGLARDPDWYTDLPHAPADDKQWLQLAARGTGGALPGGTFKLVRERGMPRLYCLGSSGRGRVILKLTFQAGPFKSLSWAEL
ncbi:MAG: hypothetical protein JW873_02970 [Candidatus Saganbacteria bacterium]|nr:hypothetical protein [Candidatus Saganbacteria bacterium]